MSSSDSHDFQPAGQFPFRHDMAGHAFLIRCHKAEETFHQPADRPQHEKQADEHEKNPCRSKKCIAVSPCKNEQEAKYFLLNPPKDLVVHNESSTECQQHKAEGKEQHPSFYI